MQQTAEGRHRPIKVLCRDGNRHRFPVECGYLGRTVTKRLVWTNSPTDTLEAVQHYSIQIFTAP